MCGDMNDFIVSISSSKTDSFWFTRHDITLAPPTSNNSLLLNHHPPTLRSGDLVAVPRTKLAGVGDCAFSSLGPQLWLSLTPSHPTPTSTLTPLCFSTVSSHYDLLIFKIIMYMTISFNLGSFLMFVSLSLKHFEITLYFKVCDINQIIIIIVIIITIIIINLGNKNDLNK